MPRNTNTGGVLEDMVLPALKRGGYAFQKQVDIGTRPGGNRHKVDIVAQAPDNRLVLISLKWQQTHGTAEQKVPFEVICLLDAIRNGAGKYRHAYLVLGGNGWALREFYTHGGLNQYLTHQDIVSIITLESFVARANSGLL